MVWIQSVQLLLSWFRSATRHADSSDSAADGQHMAGGRSWSQVRMANSVKLKHFNAAPCPHPVGSYYNSTLQLTSAFDACTSIKLAGTVRNLEWLGILWKTVNGKNLLEVKACSEIRNIKITRNIKGIPDKRHSLKHRSFPYSLCSCTECFIEKLTVNSHIAKIKFFVGLA